MSILRVPIMIYNFRSVLPGGKIKGLTFSLKEKAYIGDNAAAGHWIKDKIAGFCEIEQCVGNKLCRYPPGPIVSKSFTTPAKYALLVIYMPQLNRRNRAV